MNRYPPFNPAPPDGYNRRMSGGDRAARLAKVIRKAWADCGHSVEVYVGNADYAEVRSNLQNGLAR